jgi:hypothetical protein
VSSVTPRLQSKVQTAQATLTTSSASLLSSWSPSLTWRPHCEVKPHSLGGGVRALHGLSASISQPATMLLYNMSESVERLLCNQSVGIRRHMCEPGGDPEICYCITSTPVGTPRGASNWPVRVLRRRCHVVTSGAGSAIWCFHRAGVGIFNRAATRNAQCCTCCTSCTSWLGTCLRCASCTTCACLVFLLLRFVDFAAYFRFPHAQKRSRCTQDVQSVAQVRKRKGASQPPSKMCITLHNLRTT